MRLPRDTGGALLVGLISIVLFITAMGSLVLVGHNAGTRLRAERMATLRSASLPEESSGVGPNASQVPVLCYHYLRGRSSPLRLARVFAYVVLSLPVIHDNALWTVSQSTFDRHLRYLKRNGYRTVTLDELTAWQLGQITLPDKSVAITFDDGDRSVYDYAWPLLRRYGMRATLFLSTAHVGEKWEGIRMLSWYALREMQDSGVIDVQSHSHRMHYKVVTRLGTAPVFLAAERGWAHIGASPSWRTAVRNDLKRSSDLIEKHLGHRARYLAWPYGLGSESLDSLAVDAGFVRPAEMMGGTNERFHNAAAGVFSAAGTETSPLSGEIAAPGFAPADATRGLDGHEINRIAITARTSMRDLIRALHGETAPER